MVVRLGASVAATCLEAVTSQAVGAAAQSIAILLLLVFVSLQGSVAIELNRKLARLRRQLLAERPPSNANLEKLGKDLPPLEGVSLGEMRPVAWSDCLPESMGMLLVLDPIDESSWFVAEEIADRQLNRLRMPLVILVAAVPIDAQRFLQRTALIHDPRVVLVGPRSPMLKRLGIDWRPAVLFIREGALRAAAQFHDVKHLEAWAYIESSRLGGGRPCDQHDADPVAETLKV